MQNAFYALISRMRYIGRWGLMRNTFQENIQEHSHMVAVLAHALAMIRRNILNLPAPDPDRCASAALFHDASEIITGDLPTPVKYYSHDIRDSYKQIEHLASSRLLDMLPQQLRGDYEPLLMESDPEVAVIVKCADKLSAYIKCLEEEKAGNAEFSSAAAQTLESMTAMNRPELNWFLGNCMEPFRSDLDQLHSSLN